MDFLCPPWPDFYPSGTPAHGESQGTATSPGGDNIGTGFFGSALAPQKVDIARSLRSGSFTRNMVLIE